MEALDALAAIASAVKERGEAQDKLVTPTAGGALSKLEATGGGGSDISRRLFGAGDVGVSKPAPPAKMQTGESYSRQGEHALVDRMLRKLVADKVLNFPHAKGEHGLAGLVQPASVDIPIGPKAHILKHKVRRAPSFLPACLPSFCTRLPLHRVPLFLRVCQDRYFKSSTRRHARHKKACALHPPVLCPCAVRVLILPGTPLVSSAARPRCTLIALVACGVVWRVQFLPLRQQIRSLVPGISIDEVDLTVRPLYSPVFRPSSPQFFYYGVVSVTRCQEVCSFHIKIIKYWKV